jgi:hypothetical protein
VITTIHLISKILEIIGAGTICIVIYFLIQLWWEKWGQFWFKFHKHSFKVHHIWRIDDKERGCEKWDLYCKCEKCGKFKQITFWNDGIKLEVKDGEQND